jgi:hypothetical protein
MRRESFGRAYAWNAGGQWFHAASNDVAPPEAMLVERFLICGQIVLRFLPPHGGGVVRGARPYLAPPFHVSPAHVPGNASNG